MTRKVEAKIFPNVRIYKITWRPRDDMDMYDSLRKRVTSADCHCNMSSWMKSVVYSHTLPAQILQNAAKQI